MQRKGVLEQFNELISLESRVRAELDLLLTVGDFEGAHEIVDLLAQSFEIRSHLLDGTPPTEGDEARLISEATN